MQGPLDSRASPFTPQDRKAEMESLRGGNRWEQNGTGIFISLSPRLLGFCGKCWYETEDTKRLRFETCGQCVEERVIVSELNLS
jgi:hypothetical protein